jgi:SAM-dependent methyltransferase
MGLITFNADDSAAYEKSMGRWSRRLAVPFIEFASIGGATKVLDVGCGTGSLAFALAGMIPRAIITGLDCSQAYINHAREQAADTGLWFEQGDAAALLYKDGEFDAVLSLLALNFVPDPERAVGEMKRVTKRGGVVAASVWDYRGGLTFLRMFADTAAALDPAGEAFRTKLLSTPLTAPGEFVTVWRKIGLRDTVETSLTIRMEFKSFADYWEPWLGGQGPIGNYVVSLTTEKRTRLEHHLRLAYLSGGEDGPRSFAATACVVRGTV